MSQQKHQTIDAEKIKTFCSYVKNHLTGHEKGEGQIFFDRLLQAFGNAGVKEVGATCESRIERKRGKKNSLSSSHRWADFVWPHRVLIELKKRGEKLEKHYDQLFDNWCHKMPRVKYAALCNFDEVWIYDFNQQLYDPVDKIKVEKFPSQHHALAFLYPQEEEPAFGYNYSEITEKMARTIGEIYKSLTDRKAESAVKAQQFVLQIVVALFAEDVGLIQERTIYRILKKMIDDPEATSDVTKQALKQLFLSMSTKNVAQKTGEFKNVPFFNGGLFQKVETVELSTHEWQKLYEASKQNWRHIRPSIFGAIFEASTNKKLRHGHGIHYTSELDIQKIVEPTIVRPLKEKIQRAQNKQQLQLILNSIRHFKVLDPACGCGNFLYVAFRELRRLEAEVIESLNSCSSRSYGLSTKNFYGIDTNPFGLELAKLALSIGRRLSALADGIGDSAVPFDNLDKNFICEDALLTQWPQVDAIIGNPPFLGSKKMKAELGVVYVNKIRKIFFDIPNMADYCVYWFYKTHNELNKGQRAGLVGTNTIRETNSRQGSLEYIVNNKGTIFEAVSSQIWSGEAAVHVSIVNWIKGPYRAKKKLSWQEGSHIKSPWRIEMLNHISSSLKSEVSVAHAAKLNCNQKPKKTFVGQAPQSEGFYISEAQRDQFSKDCNKRPQVIFPFLVGRDLYYRRQHSRYVIDFGNTSLPEAAAYKNLFAHIKSTVLPDVEKKVRRELKNEGRRAHWSSYKKRWWQFWCRRPELLEALTGLHKYIALSRVSTYPIFDFVSSRIRPGDALQIFAFEDNYSFGVLQSVFHIKWLKARCSTLGHGDRYTGNTVFATFPWPQNPSLKKAQNISAAVDDLMQLRKKLLKANSRHLKDIYDTIDVEGQNPLKQAHNRLDKAVAKAYNVDTEQDILHFLLRLNQQLHEKEKSGLKVCGPGRPDNLLKYKFISKHKTGRFGL